MTDYVEANDDEAIRLEGLLPLATEAAAGTPAASLPARADGVLALLTVNEAFVSDDRPDRAMRACRFTINGPQDLGSATTGQNGYGELDIGAAADGEYRITVSAPSTSTQKPSRGFPTSGVDEVYLPLEGRIAISGGAITGVEGAGLSLEGGAVRAALWPLWMESGQSSDRGNNSVDTIVIHHTGTMNLRSVMQTSLTGGVSAHYVVATDGRLTKLVPEARTAWHGGYAHWRGRGSTIEAVGASVLYLPPYSPGLDPCMDGSCVARGL